MIFNFLGKGTDKVTRLSTINECENGGLKMIHLESTIKSLRLAWLKRIFQCNSGAWRSFLRLSLEPFGGLFLFHCNYDIYSFPLNSIWSYFNGGLSFVMFLIVEGNVNIFCGITKRYVLIISLFSIKKLFEQGVIFVNDLLFEFDTTNSYTIVSNKISKVNYLIWAGLCHSVPKHVKNSNCLRSEISLILTINNEEFDILEKKSKDYYMLIKRIIAQCPKNSKHLCQDFNLTQDQLKKVFLLPHEVAFEPYLKAFQYKVLNSILFTIKSYAK